MMHIEHHLKEKVIALCTSFDVQEDDEHEKVASKLNS